MNKKTFLLIPLIGLSLICSCNAKEPTKDELVAKGQAITNTFTQDTKTDWTCNLSGWYLNFWDSTEYPCSMTGKYGFVDDSNYQSGDENDCASMLFQIPTKIDTDHFEATLLQLSDYLAPTGALKQYYMSLDKTSSNGILFYVHNKNMQLSIFGLQSDSITSQYRANTTNARWSIEVEYNSSGYLVSERAWINATYTKDKNKTADITATYTLS